MDSRAQKYWPELADKYGIARIEAESVTEGNSTKTGIVFVFDSEDALNAEECLQVGILKVCDRNKTYLRPTEITRSMLSNELHQKIECTNVNLGKKGESVIVGLKRAKRGTLEGLAVGSGIYTGDRHTREILKDGFLLEFDEETSLRSPPSKEKTQEHRETATSMPSPEDAVNGLIDGGSDDILKDPNEEPKDKYEKRIGRLESRLDSLKDEIGALRQQNDGLPAELAASPDSGEIAAAEHDWDAAPTELQGGLKSKHNLPSDDIAKRLQSLREKSGTLEDQRAGGTSHTVDDKEGILAWLKELVEAEYGQPLSDLNSKYKELKELVEKERRLRDDCNARFLERTELINRRCALLHLRAAQGNIAARQSRLATGLDTEYLQQIVDQLDQLKEQVQRFNGTVLKPLLGITNGQGAESISEKTILMARSMRGLKKRVAVPESPLEGITGPDEQRILQLLQEAGVSPSTAEADDEAVALTSEYLEKVDRWIEEKEEASLGQIQTYRQEGLRSTSQLMDEVESFVEHHILPFVEQTLTETKTLISEHKGSHPISPGKIDRFREDILSIFGIKIMPIEEDKTPYQPKHHRKMDVREHGRMQSDIVLSVDRVGYVIESTGRVLRKADVIVSA